MDAQKLEQIQKIFSNNRFIVDDDAVIEQVKEGYAKCWLEIQPYHLDTAGTVMRGVIFTLADFVFAVASNWNEPLHVSATSQITYLGVTRGICLIAGARKVGEGRSTCCHLVEVKDDLGNGVAHATAGDFLRGQS